MKKYIKKHLKDEKRILKLMYKKGLFKTLGININHLEWEYLLSGKRKRRRKGKKKYASKEYLPELHEWTQDYWGEGDCHSIVSVMKDHIFWIDTDPNDYEEYGYPKNAKFPKTKDVIDFLLKLPTINNDSKFNIFLKRSLE